MRALRHQHVAPVGRVVEGQPALCGHIRNETVTLKNRFVTQPHLGSNNHVTVKQSADTNQYDRTVCSQVAELVGGTRFGCDHRPFAMRGIANLRLNLPTTRTELLHDPGRRRRRRIRHYATGPVTKGPQALNPHALFKNTPVSDDFWGVATDAQAGANHQKRQYQQKPPRAVNRVE